VNKRRFLQSAAALALAGPAWRAWAAAPDAAAVVLPVVRHYAALVRANYEDSLAGAQELQAAVKALAAAPGEQTLADARGAWTAAREWYGQTEAFRFYGGPIDDDKGPEGRINAWPMDEAYVDAVAGKPGAGIINNRKAALTKAALSRANERGGEENVSCGWHAIEFLLWGQDQSETGPGARPFEDFVDGKAPNADRRRRYLLLANELLIDDLRFLVNAWAPAARNYRARFERGGMESLRKIIVGVGSLSRGELAGERMEVAMNTQDQEDEHSCFSDNTHRDIVANALGIENVWLGRYKRRDGSTLQGASLNDLVAAKDAALAGRVVQQIAASVAAAQAIQAPFDREIIGGNDAPGRQRVRKTIDSLVQQSKDMVDAAAALGITRLTLVKPE
jgi:putative iron-regulated protein